MKRSLVFCTVAWVVAWVGYAETCHWSGLGSDGRWGNPANWQEGKVPGVIRSGTTAADTSGSRGDTAVFGPVTAGARTAVDIRPLISIGRCVIAAGAPVYTFSGESVAPFNAISLEPDGVFEVESGVENMPVLTKTCGIRDGGHLAYSGGAAADPDKAREYHIVNNGTGTLTLPSIRRSTSVNDKEEGSYYCQVLLEGTGAIRLDGEVCGGTERMRLWQKGAPFVIGTSIWTWGYNLTAPVELTAAASEPVSVEILRDCNFGLRPLGAQVTVKAGDLTIGGEGYFVYTVRDVQQPMVNMVKFVIAAGRTLTMAAKMCSRIDATRALNPNVPFLFDTSVQSGAKIAFKGEVLSSKPLMWFNPGTLETDAIDSTNPSVTNHLGTARELLVGSAGIISYTGLGETTTRDIVVTNVGTGCSCTLANDGAGVWTVNSVKPCRLANQGYTVRLAGSAQRAVLASPIVDNGTGQCSIYACGPCVWSLQGAISSVGTLFMQGGTVVVPSDVAFNTMSVNYATGELVLEGGAETPVSRTIPKLRKEASGESVLRLTGKSLLTIGTFTSVVGDSPIDVVTEDESTVVTVTDSSLRGKSLPGIRLNGYPVRVTAEGVMTLDADAVIAARGDVVPSVGSVIILPSGSGGDDTIADPVTTVSSLSQYSKTPATIAVGAGRRLAAKALNVLADAAPLTIGAEGEEGAFGPDNNGVVDAQLRVTVDNASGHDILLRAAYTNSFQTGSFTLKAGGLCVSGAPVRLKNADILVGTVASRPASLSLRDGADLRLDSYPMMVGNLVGGPSVSPDLRISGRLVVSNAVFRNTASSTSVGKLYHHALIVGHNACGTLEVEEDGFVSNKVAVASGCRGNFGSEDGFTAGGGQGAVYIRGGTVVAMSGNINPHRGSGLGMGKWGHGYLELQSGRFESVGHYCIGGYGTGLWHQYGGTALFRRYNGTKSELQTVYGAYGNGGTCDILLMGGLMSFDNWFVLPGGALASGRNHAQLAVSGEGAVLETTKYIGLFAGEVNSLTARVTVANGGRIRAPGFAASQAATARSDLSFDGGTFVATEDGRNVFNVAGTPPTAVTVYSNGMTVDTAGHTGLLISTPIVGANGRGVSDTGLDIAAFPAGNAPPAIWISGDGQGATAHALFDAARQCVTGIVITCAGTGYTRAQATAYYGAFAGGPYWSQTRDCTLERLPRGGDFAKRGAGDLTLSSQQNSWDGDTVVFGGTLKLVGENSIPTASPLVLRGGAVDTSAAARPALWGVDMRDVRADGRDTVRYPGDFAFTASDVLVIRHPELVQANRTYTVFRTDGVLLGEAPQLGGGLDTTQWRLVKVGSTIKLAGIAQGLFILVH